MSNHPRPLHDRVLLRRQKDDQERPSGLVIFGAQNEDVQTSEVLRVGPKCEYVKPGDFVLHVRVLGVKQRRDGEDLAIIKEHELLAVVEEGVLVEGKQVIQVHHGVEA